jgi:hypothetical protein
VLPTLGAKKSKKGNFWGGNLKIYFLGGSG